MSAATHRCSSCGTPGRPSLADPPADDQRVVLALVWIEGRPMLLCDRCREAVWYVLEEDLRP